MLVTALRMYPVKGCRGIDVTEAVVEPWGLRDDRRWMVVDATGRYQSQREDGSLARVIVRLLDEGIELETDGLEPITVKPPVDGALTPVRVWGASFEAIEADPRAGEWFSELLGRTVRLVWLDDPHRRPLRKEYGTPATFSDGFPLHVTNTASLDALNDWLAETGVDPVPMDRFRANVVVDAENPWDEDDWAELAAPDVTLWTTKPCPRCVVPNTDQQTGIRASNEPLLTLTRRRRVGNEVPFGLNMAPRAEGVIRVGDRITAS